MNSTKPLLGHLHLSDMMLKYLSYELCHYWIDFTFFDDCILIVPHCHPLCSFYEPASGFIPVENVVLENLYGVTKVTEYAYCCLLIWLHIYLHIFHCSMSWRGKGLITIMAKACPVSLTSALNTDRPLNGSDFELL